MVTRRVKVVNEYLEDILRWIRNGEFQLPDFQREWRWGNENICSLLASVSSGIPIGSVLLMESNDRLAPRLFAGVDGTLPPPTPRSLILDGQQRLTALYQACYSGQPVAVSAGRGVSQREYYFRMERCLTEMDDREECVFSEPIGASPSSEILKQYEQGVFPASLLFQYSNWRDGYLKHHNGEDSKRAIADGFRDAVVRNFTHYNIPTVEIAGSDLVAACIAFEKMNVGGKKLDAFEIITAKLRREKFNLKADWQAQRSTMIQQPVLSRIHATHYLKAMALLVTQITTDGHPSARRKDMMSLSRAQYESHSPKVTLGFTRAAHQLREFGITRANELAYVPQAIVLASVFGHLPTRRTNSREARMALKRWYWTTLLNGSYGSRVSDAQMASDFSELVKTIQNSQQPTSSAFLGNQFNANLLVSQAEKNLKTAVQAMLAREQRTQDWMTGRPMDIENETKSEMHHIFPKKWCDEHGIDEDRKESVANATLIDQETNRIIGFDAPSVYLPKLQKRADITDSDMDQILESHLIPAQALRADDFETFHEERAKRLKQMIIDIIGHDRVTGLASTSSNG